MVSSDFMRTIHVLGVVTMIRGMVRTGGVAVETGSAAGVARRKARNDAGARTVVDTGASLQNDTPSAASVKARLRGN